MKFRFALAVAATLTSLGASAQNVTILDFLAGPPQGMTVSGNSLLIQGYEFKGSDLPVAVSHIGFWRGVDWGYGMSAPVLSAPLTQNNITVSRRDGQSFSLTGISPFVGGILVGGMADFKITPFDAAGNELDPVFLQAGQFYTTLTLPSVWYPTLTNMSAFRLSPSLVDHYTGFQLSAAVAPVPEPTNWVLLLAGLGLVLSRGALRPGSNHRA